MNNEQKKKLAKVKSNQNQVSVAVFNNQEIEKMHDQLNKLYEQVHEAIGALDTKDEVNKTNKALVALNNNLVELIGKFEQGIDVTNFDKIKDQAEIIVSNLSDIPRNVKVDNQVVIPDWLAKDESIKNLHTQIIGLLTTFNKQINKAPNQQPADFVPFRRVRYNGTTLEFDDKTWSTGGGGGGGSSAAQALTGLVPYEYDDITITWDVNNNPTVVVYKLGGATKATLTITWDVNNNPTHVVRS